MVIPQQIFLFCVDSTLGRVDCRSLSDQTLMEMFFEDFDEEVKERYKDNEGMYLDVREWPCVTCDDDGRVVEISARGLLNGSLQLCYIPPKVQSLSLLSKQLTGSIDLTHLPADMKELQLSVNRFSESIDLTLLPESMENLSLHNNRLTGTIDLTKFSKSMKNLFLNNNRFEGEIDLKKLPEGMFSLYLQENLFSGSFIATNLPPSLMQLGANGNQFHSIAVVDAQTRCFINITHCGVTSVVDENGNEKRRGILL